MTVHLDSPRFSAFEFKNIAAAVDNIGHAVLENVWDLNFINSLQQFVQGQWLYPTRLIPPEWDTAFFTELEHYGLTALFRHLHNGNFFVGSTERVLRYANPNFMSGLHFDGQLHPCSEQGINSKREFTLWTPLTDCSNDDTPRLLMLKRGEYDSNNLLQLRREGEPQVKRELSDPAFAHLFASAQCYAPRIPLGSAILFERDIYHGSYRTPAMTRKRFSLDFRVTGDFRRSRKNAHFRGMFYRQQKRPSELQEQLATARVYAKAILKGDRAAAITVGEWMLYRLGLRRR